MKRTRPNRNAPAHSGLSYPKEQRIWKRFSDGQLYVTFAVSTAQIRLVKLEDNHIVAESLDIHGLEEFYKQFTYWGRVEDEPTSPAI